MSSMKIGLTGDLKKELNQFADDLKGTVLTGAMAAGARVLYEELLVRIPVAEGVLRDSAYRYLDRETETGPNRTYFVGVNMAKAKHWWLVEYGHMQTYQIIKTRDGKWLTLKNRLLPAPRFVPGKPYLRPTAAAKMGAALDAVKVRFAEKIREVSK